MAAALVHEAIGDQLVAMFVDTGLLRRNEGEQVASAFRNHLHSELITVDASEEFLSALVGVTEPEQKRRIVGEKFIRVLDRYFGRRSLVGDHTFFDPADFPWIADNKKELSEALGILHPTEKVPLRATYIVDPDGIIRWVSVRANAGSARCWLSDMRPSSSDRTCFKSSTHGCATGRTASAVSRFFW